MRRVQYVLSMCVAITLKSITYIVENSSRPVNVAAEIF